MINLNSYIVEKLHLNKDINLISSSQEKIVDKIAEYFLLESKDKEQITAIRKWCLDNDIEGITANLTANTNNKKLNEKNNYLSLNPTFVNKVITISPKESTYKIYYEKNKVFIYSVTIYKIKTLVYLIDEKNAILIQWKAYGELG